MSEALAAFERAVGADLWSQRRPGIEKWRTRNFDPAPGDPCQLCGQPSAAPLVLAHLISVDLGGSHAPENLLASCKECAARSQVSDWTTRKSKPKNNGPTLAARRVEVLALSENHLLRTRDTARTKPFVAKLLQRRWQHPRFLVRACLTEQSGLLAFPQHAPMPEGIAALVRLQGGQPVAGAPRLFRVPPDHFLDLMWQLIEFNAWVRRVKIEAFPDPTPQDDGASRWGETYLSVHDIARRGKSMRGLVDPVPWHEKPMDPRTRLHMAVLFTLKTGQPIHREWLASHRNADEDYLGQRRRRFDQSWRTRHDGSSGIPRHR